MCAVAETNVLEMLSPGGLWTIAGLSWYPGRPDIRVIYRGLNADNTANVAIQRECGE